MQPCRVQVLVVVVVVVLFAHAWTTHASEQHAQTRTLQQQQQQHQPAQVQQQQQQQQQQKQPSPDDDGTPPPPPQRQGMPFDPMRTRFVSFNKDTNAWMFRGNEPLTPQGEFAWDELVETLRKVAVIAGVPPPSAFRMYDVSLLLDRVPYQGTDLAAERAFFQSNPSKGEVINWPLLADFFGPCSMPQSKRDAAAKSGQWDSDDMPAKIAQLHELMTQQSAIPTVVYIHDEQGVDRTGQLVGAYLMQYHNVSFDNVIAMDNSIGRPVSVWVVNGLEWYALHVELALGLSTPNFQC